MSKRVVICGNPGDDLLRASIARLACAQGLDVHFTGEPIDSGSQVVTPTQPDIEKMVLKADELNNDEYFCLEGKHSGAFGKSKR